MERTVHYIDTAEYLKSKLEHQQSSIVETRASNENLVLALRESQYEAYKLSELLNSLMSTLPINPEEYDLKITSHYGESRGTHIHQGIDIPLPIGTPLYATSSGRVEYVYDDRGGHIAKIYTSSDVVIKYMHLKDRVIEGEVLAGDIIALSGNTGSSSGPHLHFEIWVKGRPVDPELLIKLITQSNYE